MCVSYTENPFFLPVFAAGLPHHCYTSDTLILLLHFQSRGSSQLSLIVIIFFYFSLFHLSFFFLLYFCLSPGWLEWVSRRLCCVVSDSSLGARLSLMQLLGPTVFLKSVSINIIMACSRHHWIFYCNVQQNITPTLSATQRKSYCLTETFYFDWKVFVRSFSSVELFVFLLCFPFCALGKVRGPCLIKWLRVFFFLSGIYYWHFPGIGLGAPRVAVLYLIVHLSSQENHVVQSCRLNTTSSSPYLSVIEVGVWVQEVLRVLTICGKIVMLCQKCTVHKTFCISCIFYFLPSLSTALSYYCVHRWAGCSDHVSSFSAGSSHDRQGARFLEWCYSHGLLHLWVVLGRPAALSVQVAFIDAIALAITDLTVIGFVVQRYFAGF